MGLFSRKKKEEPEREPVKELDRSDYVKTTSPKKETKVKKTATEKKPAEKKTAAKKETAAKKPAAKKETAAKPSEKKTAAKPAAKKPAAEKKPAPKKESKTYHIVKNVEKNKWQVKATENDKATRLFNTKAEAEEYVKTLKANNSNAKVVTHKKDGKFQKK